MVPSGAIAGALFMPARCVPQGVVGGLELGCGGQGKNLGENWMLQRPLLAGTAPALVTPGARRAAEIATLTVSLESTFTSHELTTSLVKKLAVGGVAIWITL